MAKATFTKLGLKKQDNIKTITINGQIIEIKQYLSVNDKLDLIARVLMGAHDENNFSNPIKLEVFGCVEVIMAYTNISFTDKQKEDVAKLYDLMSENGIIEVIFSQIPEDEINFVFSGINKIVESVYAYENSALGILDSISKDYSNLNLDVEQLQDKISNPENLALLKDIITKLG